METSFGGRIERRIYIMYNGNELDKKDLDMVNGGINISGKNDKTAIAYCEHCKKETTFIVYTGGRARCSVCKKEKFM